MNSSARARRLHLRSVPASDVSANVLDAEHLIGRVAIGDHAAYSLLYDQLAPTVYGLALRVVRAPALAEEITQDVLLEVWKQAPRYDASRATVKTWVSTITHRRAVDRVRREQSYRDRHEKVAGREDRPTPDPVADVTIETDEQTAVAKALSSLTPTQRESIELAFYGGHTYPEVATLLGLPLGTVKTRIRDGLIRLRDALGVNLPHIEMPPSGAGATP